MTSRLRLSNRNLMVVAYLAYLGNAGAFVAPLLWPLVTPHAMRRFLARRPH
jgi:hypothetical protein